MKQELLDVTKKEIKFKIAIGDNIKDNSIRNIEFSWEQLISVIENPIERYVSYTKINNSLANEHNDIIKNILKNEKLDTQYFIGGYFKKLYRANNNLEARTLIVLDIDKYHKNIIHLENLLKSELKQYKYIAYSTTSHTPEAPCIRLILKPSRDIYPNEYKLVVGNLIETLSFKDSIDTTASTVPSQAMYLPSIIKITDQPKDKQHYFYSYWSDVNVGKDVDINSISANIIPFSAFNNSNAEYNHFAISDDVVRECLDNYPAASLDFHGWMEVCMALHYNYRGEEKGYNILDQWSKQDSAKYDEPENKKLWNGIKDNADNPKTFSSILKKAKSTLSENWQKTILYHITNLTEKFNEEKDLLPIIQGIAKYCSDSEAEFYIREIKDYTKLGLGVLRNLIKKEHKKIIAEEVKTIGNKIFPIDEPLPPALFEGYLGDESSIKTTINNLKILIKHYGITIKSNVISREEEITIPNHNNCGDSNSEATFAMLVNLCELNNLNKIQHLQLYCNYIANNNPYNPIVDVIQSKPWDGKSRLQELYETIKIEEGFDIEFAQLLIRKWLISMVGAVFEEKGIFSKGVLLFQSKQSVGKTTWFKNLLPKSLSAYFKDGAHLDPTDKDSVKTAISNWLVELGEIDSTFTKDIARLKAFISSDKDIFRLKYARKDSAFARRTIFCGTVNKEEVLKDRTGNVRFWIIPVIELLKNTHIDMQQLWAEMYEIYKSGERWWLVPVEEEKLEQSNEFFLETCPYEETIKEHFKPYSNHSIDCPQSNKKTATEILIQLRQIWNSNIQIDQRGTRAVASAMRRLGFKRELGGKKRYFVEAV